MQAKNNNTINCERCKQPFVCNAADISNCDCTKIQLTQSDIAQLKERYSACLCNACLLELKNEIDTTNN